MRTKYTKLKRALARRKRKAHAIRANKFVQKERKKFIHSFKANAANPAHILQNGEEDCNVNLLTDNEDDEVQSHKESDNEQQKVNMRSRNNHDKLKAKSCPHGLRGGGGFNTHISSQYEYPHHLQLINSGSDCFVNSVIQLLRVTDYAYFLKMKFAPLLADATSQDYNVCKTLSRLYSGKTRGQVSVGSIRRFLAVWKTLFKF